MTVSVKQAGLELLIVDDTIPILVAGLDDLVHTLPIELRHPLTTHHLQQLTPLHITVPIFVNRIEHRLNTLLGKQLRRVHTTRQELVVVNTPVFVSVNRLHYRGQLLDRWLVFFVLQSQLQLVDRDLAVMVEIHLSEEFPQVFDFLLRQLSSDKSSS